MDRSEEMAKLRSIITESIDETNAIGELLQPNPTPAHDELEALMKKYGVMEDGACNMTAEGEECPVHGMSECVIMAAENDTGFGRNDDMEESMHITLDGPEADAMINRLMSLSGQLAPEDAHYMADVCPTCGNAECDCSAGCDCPEGACTCDSSHEMPAMENADYDHGHEVHDDEGEVVDQDMYMYKAPAGDQRFVKMGDNPLIKEDADKLFSKLKGDYKAYIAEAELARSNTGTDSPLTATDRDEFDKDPFAGDEPVTDGTRSPLSTIKRQSVAK